MWWLLVAQLLTGLPAPGPHDLPNPVLTPGVATTIDTATVCATSWGHDVRHVDDGMKLRIAEAYGLTKDQAFGHVTIKGKRHAAYEFDHLISRELGGADDEKNIWPQPWMGDWNAHMKDVLENKLHQLVCSGRLSLADAQQAIAANWINAYARYVLQ